MAWLRCTDFYCVVFLAITGSGSQRPVLRWFSVISRGPINWPSHLCKTPRGLWLYPSVYTARRRQPYGDPRGRGEDDNYTQVKLCFCTAKALFDLHLSECIFSYTKILDSKRKQPLKSSTSPQTPKTLRPISQS